MYYICIECVEIEDLEDGEDWMSKHWGHDALIVEYSSEGKLVSYILQREGR